MSVAVLLGLLSAVANAASAVVSKDLARRFPARQLIGPLFALNALVLLPAAPFVSWTWTPTVALLHGISVGLLIITALAVWDLFDHGAASATVAAQSLSPLPTALAVAVLLPGVMEPVQAVAAVIVVGAVTAALADSFEALGRARTLLTVLAAATGTGLVTVMGRLLADEGAGVVETYVVRTAVAAAIFMAAFPPRDIPLRQLPRLTIRAVLVTAHFVLILIGVQDGSPAEVQTAVATAPLLVLAWEVARTRRRPSGRVVIASLAAATGVSVLLLT
ncbi:hypothetical protein BH20CHL6_BH20CHL6_10050 [soil metagenome]